jgi:hypothetical protein
MFLRVASISSLNGSSIFWTLFLDRESRSECERLCGIFVDVTYFSRRVWFGIVWRSDEVFNYNAEVGSRVVSRFFSRLIKLGWWVFSQNLKYTQVSKQFKITSAKQIFFWQDTMFLTLFLLCPLQLPFLASWTPICLLRWKFEVHPKAAAHGCPLAILESSLSFRCEV